MTAVIEPDKKKHNFTFWRFHSISCCRPPPIIQYTGAVNKSRRSWHHLNNSGGDEFTWPHLIITSWCAVKEPLYLRGSALVIREAVIQLSLPLPLFLFTSESRSLVGTARNEKWLLDLLVCKSCGFSNVGLSKITFSWLRVSWWQPLCVPDLVFSLPRPLISCVLSSALSALPALSALL